jgi:hypothetical protein
MQDNVDKLAILLGNRAQQAHFLPYQSSLTAVTKEIHVLEFCVALFQIQQHVLDDDKAVDILSDDLARLITQRVQQSEATYEQAITQQFESGLLPKTANLREQANIFKATLSALQHQYALDNIMLQTTRLSDIQAQGCPIKKGA